MTGFGREEAETQKRMQAAEAKLAGEVQDMVKARSDSERMSKDAEEGAKAPATSVKMPTRPGQGAKPKSGIVTKEELEKSGLSLRDYMNNELRFRILQNSDPDRARELAALAQRQVDERFARYQTLAAQADPNPAES
jgi:hypothetical protein